MRVLVDINVVLDVLLDREPHVAAAAKLWAAVEAARLEALLPAHGVTTVFYLTSRARGPAFAQTVVADLLAVFGVAPVDRAVLARAVALGWPDFEDAVCAAAAEASACHGIVTRDPNGFLLASVPVVDPATVITLLSDAGGSDWVAEAPAERFAPRRKAPAKRPATPKR